MPRHWYSNDCTADGLQLTTICRNHQVLQPQHAPRFPQRCCRIATRDDFTSGEWSATFRNILLLSPWRTSSPRRLTAWPWRWRHCSPESCGTALSHLGGISRTRSNGRRCSSVRTQIAARYQKYSTDWTADVMTLAQLVARIRHSAEVSENPECVSYVTSLEEIRLFVRYVIRFVKQWKHSIKYIYWQVPNCCVFRHLSAVFKEYAVTKKSQSIEPVRVLIGLSAFNYTLTLQTLN